MDFGERVLHLCFAKSGCTSAKLSKTSFQVLHSVCTDIASPSQAAPQQNFRKQVFKFCIRFALTLLRQVRLHLSIALESKLSSLCIRFALT